MISFTLAELEAATEVVRRHGPPTPQFEWPMLSSAAGSTAIGVAASVREWFDGTGPLDTVYVPAGMGSGINAMIAVRNPLGLGTQIVGVPSRSTPAS